MSVKIPVSPIEAPGDIRQWRIVVVEWLDARSTDDNGWTSADETQTELMPIFTAGVLDSRQKGRIVVYGQASPDSLHPENVPLVSGGIAIPIVNVRRVRVVGVWLDTTGRCEYRPEADRKKRRRRP